MGGSEEADREKEKGNFEYKKGNYRYIWMLSKTRYFKWFNF